MGELPFGTVTFLFTDIEGSTRLWQEDESSMRKAVARHDQLLDEVIGDHGGVVFSTMADGVAAARRQVWPTSTPLGHVSGSGRGDRREYDAAPRSCD
jgi:class 3 adenylate cyclase